MPIAAQKTTTPSCLLIRSQLKRRPRVRCMQLHQTLNAPNSLGGRHHLNKEQEIVTVRALEGIDVVLPVVIPIL